MPTVNWQVGEEEPTKENEKMVAREVKKKKEAEKCCVRQTGKVFQ
jgi:hypothetical protein